MPGTTAKYFADANRRTNWCTNRCTDDCRANRCTNCCTYRRTDCVAVRCCRV